MKLLLTGQPGSGKTTLVRHLARQLDDVFWVVSDEVRTSSGQRIGFRADNSDGDGGVFDRKSERVPGHPLAHHHVNTSVVDQVFTEPLRKRLDTTTFIIVDEIGRLERQSTAFCQVIASLLDHGPDLLATIPMGDDWTREYIDRPDAVLFELGEHVRTETGEAIRQTIAARPWLATLARPMRARFYNLARTYATSGKFILLQKLTSNAVRYVAKGQVATSGAGSFSVRGDHGTYATVKAAGGWMCDCDLYNGRLPFVTSHGDCSHIQACVVAGY